MRKLSLLLAAALMVSLPLVTAMTTDTFAAAKAKKAAKAAPAPKEETGPQPPFQSMHNALNDLGKQLATYRHDPNPAPAKGAPAKGGKKK
jgi:hypothetical protein